MERAFRDTVQTLARVLPAARQASPWHEEIRGLVRAFSSAFLFGIPLLYTMEMWWIGEMAGAGLLLVTLGITLVANFGLVTAAGFKRETSLLGRLEQTVVAVAVGAVAAAVVLLTVNQINTDRSLHTALGKVVLQVLPLSIGASLANIIFRGDGGRDGDGAAQSRMPSWRSVLFNDVGATAIGAVFIAATIAPTEEIPMLAARMDFPHLLALIALTLVAGYIIVFASGFDPAAEQDRQHLFQHPVTETTLSYLVALVVSFGVLLLTQQLGIEDPPGSVLTQTLVLGLPAMVGGAAGRIAV